MIAADPALVVVYAGGGLLVGVFAAFVADAIRRRRRRARGDRPHDLEPWQRDVVDVVDEDDPPS